MAYKMRLDIDDLTSGLENISIKSEMAIRMLAKQGGQKLQDFGRENRKWTDRTGQARQRLTGGAESTRFGYRIYLAHGVDYGIWLELAREKRFSIIPQAIEYVGAFEIMPGFERLMERLGGK